MSGFLVSQCQHFGSAPQSSVHLEFTRTSDDDDIFSTTLKRRGGLKPKFQKVDFTINKVVLNLCNGCDNDDTIDISEDVRELCEKDEEDMQPELRAVKLRNNTLNFVAKSSEKQKHELKCLKKGESKRISVNIVRRDEAEIGTFESFGNVVKQLAASGPPEEKLQEEIDGKEEDQRLL